MTISRAFDKGFAFKAYGVKITVESDVQDLLDIVREKLASVFGDRAIFIDKDQGDANHVFGITSDDGKYVLYKNGEHVTEGRSAKIFLNFLDSQIRVEVAEYARSRVFLHAGVVGWNGRAIVIPAKSFEGKSTLTAELVKNGAEYYSDDFAILDGRGFVHSFPRKISMRYFGATREKDVSAEELGGRPGTQPIPVGMVLLTGFAKGAAWDPQILTPGNGIFEILPHTIPIRRKAKFSLKVLDLVARRAIIVKSPRGDAKKFAKFLLAFFDNHTNLVRMT